MLLPANIDIPDWVNWVAQDENGSWWGFSVEPLEHSTGWYENEVGKYILLAKPPAHKKITHLNWRETLIKVRR